MAESKPRDSFFTVAFDLIITDCEMPYDLYINSSTNAKRDRFVRIFPKGGFITKNDLARFRVKYHQIYVLEDQRSLYLKSLVKSDNVEDVEKMDVLKDSAVHYLDKLFDEEKEFNTEILNETIEGCRESVENMVHVIQDYKITDIQNLIASLSFHDFYTYDHSINVSMYCINLYKMFRPKASNEELTIAGLGGMLHDLGKIKIPTNIINKPGKLEDEEFQMIKKHPSFGKCLIEEEGCHCQGVDLETIKRVIYEHHENYDGTGYPNRVKGTDIHLMARVTAIADFFDALTTKRSYHEVMSIEEAVSIMSRTVGKKIDPKLFNLFEQNTARIVNKRAPTRELPDDFDPCQPHNNLELKPVGPKKMDVNIMEKEDNYGTVKVQQNDDKKAS